MIIANHHAVAYPYNMRRRLLFSLAAMLCTASLWCSGHSDRIPISPKQAAGNTIEDSVNISSMLYSLGNLYSYIDSYCLYPVNPDVLEENLVAAVLSSIDDPYSYYIPSKDAEEYFETSSGTYIGIGIYLTKRNPANADISDPESWMVTIASVFSSSPAERAGLRARDMISHINGKSVMGMTATEASLELRGRSGQDITLTVHRGTAEFEITLRPEQIVTPTADSAMLTATIGYLAIYSFSMTTADSVRTAIESLLESGAESIIIDLRNNPGGAVESALEIADMFLSEGVLMTTEFKEGSGRRTAVDRASSSLLVPPDVKVAVLINGGSASSSEILTGALSDNGRAVTVGSKSFGKGISQEVYPFSKGYIQMTTGHFFTPDGSDIHNKGIEPDYSVEETEYTDEEMEAYERLMDEDPFPAFIEEHPEYSSENIEAFASSFRSSGVPENLLKILIRNEYLFQLDYDDRPIADPEYDAALRKAMEIML